MAAVQRAFDSNFFGTVRMVKEFSSLLMESPAAHIVNISSSSGVLPSPFLSIYSASKAALNSTFGDSLRRVRSVWVRHYHSCTFSMRPIVILDSITVTTVCVWSTSACIAFTIILGLFGSSPNSKNYRQFHLKVQPNSVYQPMKEVYDRSFREYVTAQHMSTSNCGCWGLEASPGEMVLRQRIFTVRVVYPSTYALDFIVTKSSSLHTLPGRRFGCLWSTQRINLLALQYDSLSCSLDDVLPVDHDVHGNFF